MLICGTYIKKPTDLDDDQNEFNSNLVSARKVVERFVDRMKGKFAIMNEEYCGNRDDYHKYLKCTLHYDLSMLIHM